MTQGAKIDWRGEALLHLLKEAQPEALFAAGEMVLKAATAKAPQGASGDLRASGYVSTKSKSSYRKKKTRNREARPRKDNEMVVGFSAFYALFHEIGTKNMSARPFLRPALDENKDRLGLEIAKHIRSKLEK